MEISYQNSNLFNSEEYLNNYDMKKYRSVFVIIFAFIFEIIYFKYINTLIGSINSCWLMIILIFLLLIVIIHRKNTDFIKRSVILVVKGGASSFAGILLIIYFLMNIGWLSDQLFSFSEGKSDFLLVLKIISFLILPFFINALLIKDRSNFQIENIKRTVFVTALSLNNKDQLKMFIENNFENDKIQDIPNRRFWNWIPIINVIEKYKNLTVIVAICSKEVLKELELEKAESKRNTNAFEELLKMKYSNRNIEYKVVEITNMNDFNELYNDLKFKIEKSLKNYSDEEILFGISSGTATLTASVVFLSMKGLRGLVYQKQDATNALDEFTVDVLTIHELWDEIIDRYQ
jgi:hypothetical protein